MKQTIAQYPINLLDIVPTLSVNNGLSSKNASSKIKLILANAKIKNINK